MGNMASAFEANLLIAVHNEHPPEPEAWRRYLDMVKEYQAKGQGVLTGGLTFTDGGAPNSAMRAELRETLQGGSIHGSLVSDSMVVRGVAGLIAVFVKGGKVYATRDWRAALDNVGITAWQRPALVARLRVLDSEVGGCKSLRSPLAENP